MYYYRYMNKVMMSHNEYNLGHKISEEDAAQEKSIIYYLTEKEPGRFNRAWCLSHASFFDLTNEDENLLTMSNDKNANELPHWLMEKMEHRQIMWVNTQYPNWQQILEKNHRDKWTINIVGLGDVGGILLTGLRLLGGDIVEKIGIYDINSNKVERWLMESGQILYPDENSVLPEVVYADKSSLFDCDMFVFAVSAGVPPLSGTQSDVRMAQYEANGKIISEYARIARQKKFKGIFAVVSDPVDLLCKKAFIESNRDSKGVIDYEGLGPEQIRGYGLGVMRARAAYHARKMGLEHSFEKYGRAYGPHGKGLVIADNIECYDNNTSIMLTDKALNSNMEVRSVGFKPYVAPALSSGALSILATIRGQWHYSAVYLGGVYFGCRNRLNESGTELERLNMPTDLFERIKESYNYLGGME